MNTKDIKTTVVGVGYVALVLGGFAAVAFGKMDLDAAVASVVGLGGLLTGAGFVLSADREKRPREPRKGTGRGPGIPLVALLALLILPAALTLTACPAAEKNVNTFAEVSLRAQQGVTRGIPAARALRQSGAVTPEFNLELARKARKFNSAHKAALDVALSGDADGGDLHGQLRALIEAGDDLRRDGTLKLGGKTEIIFDLGVELARSELAEFADTLEGKRGVKIVVGPAAREKLERARSAAERNAQSIDEAVRALEALTNPAK